MQQLCDQVHNGACSETAALCVSTIVRPVCLWLQISGLRGAGLWLGGSFPPHLLLDPRRDPWRLFGLPCLCCQSKSADICAPTWAVCTSGMSDSCCIPTVASTACHSAWFWSVSGSRPRAGSTLNLAMYLQPCYRTHIIFTQRYFMQQSDVHRVHTRL